MNLKTKSVILAFIIIFITSCRLDRFDAVRFFIDSNDLDKAELILNNMNKREKNSFDYNYLNGIVLAKKSVAGYKREALKCFLKANEINPNDYFNNLMIAKMSYEVNDLSEANIFADKAKGLYSKEFVNNYEEDVHHLLSMIYLMQRDYGSAYDSICLSPFQEDEHVIFLKTELSDLINGSDLLIKLVEENKQNRFISDGMQYNYLQYLFLANQMNKAEIYVEELLGDESLSSGYYGCLFKAFFCMLQDDYEMASTFIEKSYDYTIDDSLFLRYKMKFFYSYMTEENPVKIFNSFLIYKFFYEKNDEEEVTAKEDLSEVIDYMKDDACFNLLNKVKG
ncbi:tetratricopeptide repeat protein [Treponema sp.]|uniref:tetratricopeptide repeat protein n=1 Tax=Treponema sp. TaxID=166 RepID=UPI00388D0B99